MSEAEQPERRHAPRRRTLMGGTIRFTSRTGTLSCVVRNLSASGARLTCATPHWMPEQFELEILHQDLRIHARSVWRDGQGMGVEFLSADRQSVRANEQITALRAERDALQQRIRDLTDPY